MNYAENFSQGRLISIGYWDNSIKVHAIDTCKEIVSVVSGHMGAITCIESGLNNHGPIFVTGGFEGTIRVWVLEKPAYASAFKKESFYAEPLLDDMNGTAASPAAVGLAASTKGQSSSSSSLVTGGVGNNGTGDNDATTSSSSLLSCIHVLCGHTSPISSLSLSQELDIVMSGGSDGMICLHTIRSGQYLRCLPEMHGSSIDIVLASKLGYLIAHSWTSLATTVFWLNGQHLHSTTLSDR